MPSDIVLPKGNEEEFIDRAIKLNFSKLYFLYEFDSGIKEKVEEVEKLKRKIDVKCMVLARKKDVEKARRYGKVILKAGGDNRVLLSKKRVIIYGLELSKRDDFIYYRNSGLDQILCRLANKNNNIVCFSFNEILKREGYERARLIGRIMQNIKLCRKYKVKIIIGSFANDVYEMRNYKDLLSFFQLIGMTGKEAKEAFDY